MKIPISMVGLRRVPHIELRLRPNLEIVALERLNNIKSRRK